jgi:hypothetical protein
MLDRQHRETAQLGVTEPWLKTPNRLLAELRDGVAEVDPGHPIGGGCTGEECVESHAAAQCSDSTSACSRTVIVALACLSGG